jgi:hypothetical protein
VKPGFTVVTRIPSGLLVVQGLAERDNGVFRCAIDRRSGRRVPPGQGGDIHDVAAALPQHHRQERARAEHHAEEVHADDALDLLG